jgi:N-acetylglucosaminyl-diphospho-decaprenol L-rhamnosyltransferase
MTTPTSAQGEVRVHPSSAEALVDVVVVSFCSQETLRDCVEPLIGPEFHVVVVDNASPDRSLEVIRDLDITAAALSQNRGFAYGCNRGWELGSAPYVLFLNPDARVEREDVRALVGVLQRDENIGLVAPRIENDDGSLQWSRRRFPRLRSTYARAFYLHRLLPRASWTDEVIRRPDAYDRSGAAEWVSGACLLTRRSLLERLGGWDEGFFLYGEDIDLCRRAREAGAAVWFEANVAARHTGGGSAARESLLPVLAASQLRYASKHGSLPFRIMQRAGLILGTLTHLVVVKGGGSVRSGRARALRVLIRGDQEGSPWRGSRKS